MVISKAVIGIIAGGVPVAAVTTAGSLGAFTPSSVAKQVNQERDSQSSSAQGNISTTTSPKSDLPYHITLDECYEISTEQTTNIKLIFCTDTKFYLYGSDQSVTKVKSVKVTNPQEIAVELEGEPTNNKIFKVNENGWGSISKSEELNKEQVCKIHQQSKKQVLICKNNMNHPIKLPKLNK